jgi:hypothetical protein
MANRHVGSWSTMKCKLFQPACQISYCTDEGMTDEGQAQAARYASKQIHLGGQPGPPPASTCRPCAAAQSPAHMQIKRTTPDITSTSNSQQGGLSYTLREVVGRQAAYATRSLQVILPGRVYELCSDTWTEQDWRAS